MQKIAFQLLFLLLIVIFQTTRLSAADPVWILNGGADVNRLTTGQGNLNQEAGLTRILPIGSDLTVTPRLPGDEGFSAEAYPFFALRYKYKSQIRHAGLFFTTETLTELSDKSYSQFPVEPDNTWRNTIIDMRSFAHKNWSGTITGVRLDPTNPSAPNDVLQLSRFGFFPTREAAEAFLTGAKDAPDYSEPTVFRAPYQTVFVPGNCLSDGYRQEDYLIQFSDSNRPALPCGPETVVVYSPTAEPNAAKETIPVCETNRCGYTRFSARKPGRYSLENRPVSFDDLPADPASVQAIEFSVRRGILQAVSPDQPKKFAPNAPISSDDWQKVCAALSAYDVSLNAASLPKTRQAAALEIQQAVKTRLGVCRSSNYTNEYLTRDRIRIGAWVSVSDEVFRNDFIKTYAQGGFDWIIAHSGAASPKNRDILLNDCDQYGVELILNDGAYHNPVEQTAEYFDHPCFAGTYITDEPGTDQYGKLAEICNQYVKQTGGKIPYINLLPMYANAAQLKYGAGAAAIEYYDSDPQLFRRYCDEFCKQFNVGYICTDIYPLNWVQGRRHTYPEYLESINVIAASAREYNKTFWCCLQTFAWIPSKRTPTESEFRWQAYSLLSFGCKGLLCWTYAGYNPDFPSLITQDGKRTNAWYDAAIVFKEMRRISDAFVQYRNLGAFPHFAAQSDPKSTPYLNFSNPLNPKKDFPILESFDSPAPLLIGCFKRETPADYAFTVVNMSELEKAETVSFQFQVKPGYQVVAWPLGERWELTPDASGAYSLTLPSGAGVFVVCIQVKNHKQNNL